MTNHEDPAARLTHHDPPGSPPGAWWRNAPALIASGCFCSALVIAFIGLAQFDLPVVRYVRSVTSHLPWNHLTVPWMAFTSDAGDWIGGGSRLVAVSIALFVIGWIGSKPAIRSAGIDTLIGHGLAALMVNGLKHLIGRPRPKFVHSGEWQFTPTWVSGLDSFPSGHAAASFAVATVLTKRFPVFGPICLSVAAFVALSRVLRGSHFPTDVVGGAVLGVLSGSIASAPLKQWSASLRDGLRHATLGTCAVFAVIWTLSRHVEEGIVSGLFVGIGVLAAASGLWLRRAHWLGKRESVKNWEANASVALITYGLAALTTSPLVMASVGLACLASWFTAVGSPEQQRQDSPVWLMVKESALLGSVLLALLILYDGRGVLPFQ